MNCLNECMNRQIIIATLTFGLRKMIWNWELGTLLILSRMTKETAVVATVALLKVSFGFEGGIFAGTKTAKENAVLFFGQKMTGRSVHLVISIFLSNLIDVVKIHFLKFAISTVFIHNTISTSTHLKIRPVFILNLKGNSPFFSAASLSKRENSRKFKCILKSVKVELSEFSFIHPVLATLAIQLPQFLRWLISPYPIAKKESFSGVVFKADWLSEVLAV